MKFFWFLSERRYFSFSKLWAQSHFKSDRSSGLMAQLALNFGKSLSVWMKFNRLWFLVQKRVWISSLCFAQRFMTMCFMTIVFLDQKFWSIFKLPEGALLVESNSSLAKGPLDERGRGRLFKIHMERRRPVLKVFALPKVPFNNAVIIYDS